MHTIHVQLAITLGDDTAKALVELLGPALRQAAVPANDAEERRDHCCKHLPSGKNPGKTHKFGHRDRVGLQ